MRPGWYLVGKRLHYFRNSERGSGFLSWCGQRNIDPLPQTGLEPRCRFCEGKQATQEDEMEEARRTR